TSLFFLRNLPVDIQLATRKAIAEIENIEPNIVICCGMAEKRSRLTIESQAWCEDNCLSTAIDLPKLKQSLVNTEISHDAGKFVCEGLYYQLLKYIQLHGKNLDCIFIHVPKLETNNSTQILEDFRRVLAWF
ncbi:MAG: peptidase C15, partial [Cyanobacteria bacterium J06600_6]